MLARNRRGFTLVELLVVITIIGILMALLLPAVNAAIEQARMTNCRNSVGQIAKGIAGYEARSGRKYPGWRNVIGKVPNTTTDIIVNWQIALLPDIDRMDIYKLYVSNTVPATLPSIELLNCQSDPPDVTGGPTNSYIYSAGKASVENIAFGVGIDRGNSANTTFVGSEYVTSGDGTSNTLGVSENIKAGNWNTVAIVDGKFDNCFVWYMVPNIASPPINQKINGDKLNSTALRPSSFHSGVVCAGFLDGHVTLLREDMSYQVYVQLMTTNSEKASNPASNLPSGFNYPVLSTADYQ